jgi:DNA-binding LacI/PurR family transcriptional regulator
MNVQRANADVVATINLDAHMPTALHFQLREELRRLIRDGHVGPGDRLPTVQEIARRCRLSAFTVSRAVGDLARTGELITRRGVGTFVAAARLPATEILVVSDLPVSRSLEALFRDRTAWWFRDLSGDSGRRFFVTYLDGCAPRAAELVAVCQARGVDSLVVYRPTQEVMREMRAIAARIATASLFYPVSGARVDCVTCDPAPALRRMLAERMAAGRRQFIYAGLSPLVKSQPESNPYAIVYRTFVTMLSEAGASPLVCFSDARATHAAMESDFRDVARRWPDGAVLLVSNPQLARRLDPSGARFDSISYTESRSTRREFRGRVSLLHFDLENAVRVAVRLLVEPGRARGDPQVVCLEPEIVESSARAAFDDEPEEE